jgi:amino acid adenylation domain-containing protein
MNDIAQRLADLSPEQRACLQEKLHSTRLKDIPRRAATQPTPLSFTQQRLWFLAQLDPESPAYNTSDAVRLRGKLRVDVLQQVLGMIATRHEILRTTIELLNGDPVQKVGEYPIEWEYPIELAQIDLRSLPVSEREVECQRHIQQFATQPFDLVQKPLWRVLLLYLDQTEAVLLFVRHHLISDGWSTRVFWQELAVLYEAFLNQQPSPLPELPIQYGDFALWQQQRFESGDLRSHLAYWQEQLSGTIQILELPSDRPRPAVQTFSGARYCFTVSESITTALRRLAQQEKATLFMVLLAAFNTLLYRYTQQEDIWIGTAIANRNPIVTECLIGFFANTLVMRSDLSGQPTFRDLIQQVRETALDAYTYQSFPFEKLVQELQPERSLSHNPLFQVMFALQNLPERVQTLSGLELRPIKLDLGIAKFDLTLEMTEIDGHLQALFEYNTDLFDPATIERMSGHLLTLLEGIVQDCNLKKISAEAERTLPELPLLTESERQRLQEWNATQVEIPECSVHQLFERQVEKTPNAIAVEFASQSLTYQELNLRANQLASHLQALGVVPNQLVGLCVDRSIEMVVGLLGILKAGGAYVPLNPSYPRSRLAMMLEDAQPSIIVTQSWLVGSFPSPEAQLILLDKIDSCASQISTLPIPLRKGHFCNRVYVLYTSGSTGKPKGVTISHRSLVNTLSAFQREFQLNSNDIGCAAASLSFDLATLELWTPLIAGARVVIAPWETMLEGKRLAEFLQSSHATIALFTPTTWQMLLEAGWADPSFKALCGGEALSKELANRLLTKCDRVWNLYGPTETTIYSTFCKITTAAQSPAIGRAIANTQLYVLDPHYQPVPIGIPGELYIGGTGVAIDYLNRPELTQERFISVAGIGRLYKTGDLVRYRADGNLEYLGRP